MVRDPARLAGARRAARPDGGKAGLTGARGPGGDRRHGPTGPAVGPTGRAGPPPGTASIHPPRQADPARRAGGPGACRAGTRNRRANTCSRRAARREHACLRATPGAAERISHGRVGPACCTVDTIRNPVFQAVFDIYRKRHVRHPGRSGVAGTTTGHRH